MEMNRGKKYAKNSKLSFFSEAFGWIMNNIIVINPNSRRQGKEEKIKRGHKKNKLSNENLL